MKSALWRACAITLGAAALVATGSGAKDMASSDPGSQSSYGAAAGVGDAVLRIALIVLLALATRACWRRAERAQGSRATDSGERTQRPWER